MIAFAWCGERFPDRDGEYVKLLASRLVASVPQTVALLVSAQQEPALVVLARGGDLDFHAGNLMREALAALGLRGGGCRSGAGASAA